MNSYSDYGLTTGLVDPGIISSEGDSTVCMPIVQAEYILSRRAQRANTPERRRVYVRGARLRNGHIRYIRRETGPAIEHMYQVNVERECVVVRVR